MWKNLYLTGANGSENGIIYADEEYKGACRITLEKCDNCYAVACGVYGAMVHTAFTDFDHYRELYDAMKKELQDFIDRDTTPDEEFEFYDNFTRRF